LQGASFFFDVWDPKLGTGASSHNTLSNSIGIDSFFSAAILLPETGNILMSGGDSRPNGQPNVGINDATIFNTQSNSLSSAADMSFARWYPTSTVLANGNILIAGGNDMQGRTVPTPEIYSPEDDTWTSLLGVTNDWGSRASPYPRQWVAPNGKVFGYDQNKEMYYINPDNGGNLEDLGLVLGGDGFRSSAVMYQPGKILKVGGKNNEANDGVVIDINQETPAMRIVAGPNEAGRVWVDSVVLPNGKVMIVGGSEVDNELQGVSYRPEIWDPATEAWTLMEAGAQARLYHSTAMLLRDGRVLVAGGGAPGPQTNLNAEIFSPPYLYDNSGQLASRPKITNAPKQAAYGSKVAVSHDAGSTITRATLIKTGAVTHSSNMEQRFIELEFADTNDGVSVTMPDSAILATPGYYLLHLLNNEGVPSEAHIIRISNTVNNNRTVSNSVSDNSITIDADINDWSSIPSLGYDADTLADVNTEADFLEGWMANDSDNLYLAYRNNGDINTSSWWAWQVYIDTDSSISTGFKGIDSVGAEYLLQGGGLYEYTGSGTNWSWQFVSGVTRKVNGEFAEFKIPRTALGNPSKFRAVFKTRNGVFTGDYSASGRDTYPKSFTPLRLHDDLLFRQNAIWNEQGRPILSMSLSNPASAGASQLEMTASPPLIDGQLITYLSKNREFYTAHVDTVDGQVVTLKQPLKAAIGAGQNVWNFYQDDAHPNLYGYRAIADFAIRKVGQSRLNEGRHVLLGDSWFRALGLAERLAERLENAIVINKGIGGNTSSGMLNRFDSDITSQNPDFVWVNAGINDAFRYVPTVTYLASMQGILTKISDLGAQGIVFDPAVAQLFPDGDAKRELSHSYAKALAAVGGDGFVDYEFGEAIPPPETTVVSNRKSIIIDGNLADWDGLQSFGADYNDINEVGAKADILEAWMAHDDSTFYLAYRNDGDIDKSTWWPWQAYLDTDSDENTGFKIGNGVGANYVIQGGRLFRYNGSGNNWDWEFVVAANKSVNGSIAELAFPRSSIGNPLLLRAVMKARNGIFTGNYSPSGMDSHPDVGSGHFNYKFDEAPVGPTVMSLL